MDDVHTSVMATVFALYHSKNSFQSRMFNARFTNDLRGCII